MKITNSQAVRRYLVQTTAEEQEVLNLLVWGKWPREAGAWFTLDELEAMGRTLVFHPPHPTERPRIITTYEQLLKDLVQLVERIHKNSMYNGTPNPHYDPEAV